MQDRFISILLRLAGMALKLVLTLFMAKFLSLQDLGTYGLVFAIVSIATPLYGFRFEYVASREIVNLKNTNLASKIRDQFALYGVTYGIVILFFVCFIYPNNNKATNSLLITALFLSILESITWVSSANLVSLNRQIFANVLFFIRTAAWIPFAIGFLFFSQNNLLQKVFLCWVSGLLLSIFINYYMWRDLPLKQIHKIPIDLMWLKKNIKSSLLVWIGSICLAGGGFIDRIIADSLFERSFVGVISFYGSICTIVVNLLNSGVFAFHYPKLIAAHVKPLKDDYILKCKSLAKQSFVSATVLVSAIVIILPGFLRFFEKKELSDYQFILWGMLFGVWLRSCSEFVYYMMYAEKKDKSVLFGNLIYFITSLTLNYAFFKCLGKQGVFYAALLSSIPLFIYRMIYTFKNKNE